MTPAVDSPAVSLAELIAWLDELFAPYPVEDLAPNGLQVETGGPVRRVVTGVSACHELFARARAARADLVLVHHGIFWRGDDPRLTGFRYRRVAELMAGGMALAAYHLPLDLHPDLGNNALAARQLGLEALEPFGEYRGTAIGLAGRLPEPLAPDALVARCRALFGQEPLAFLAGPDPVRTVGVLSGAAQRSIYEALDRGLDAFVTGEASEWVMNVAREAGLHFLAVGHYASERLGIRALGERVAQRFGLAVEFIDVPNPV